jgi:hypothetical protein
MKLRITAIIAGIVLAVTADAQPGAPAAPNPGLNPDQLLDIIRYFNTPPAGVNIGDANGNIQNAVKINGLDMTKFNYAGIYALQNHKNGGAGAVAAATSVEIAQMNKIVDEFNHSNPAGWLDSGAGLPPNFDTGSRKVEVTDDNGNKIAYTTHYGYKSTNDYLFESFRSDRDFYVNLQAGIVHVDAGPSEDTYWLDADLYWHAASTRDYIGGTSVSKLSLLVPDAFVSADHSIIATNSTTTTSSTATAPTNVLGEGVQFHAGLYWPLFLIPATAPTNFMGMTNFSPGFVDISLGPIYTIGLQKFINGTGADEIKFSQYGGLRFCLDNETYTDFTLGDDDALKGLRFQVSSQIPLFTTGGGGRYYCRFLWNTSHNKTDDIIRVLLSVDVPFEDALNPAKLLQDLVPTTKS